MKTMRAIAQISAMIGLWLVASSLAQAAPDLSGVAGSMTTEARGIGRFIEIFAYVMGFAVTGWGIFSFLSRNKESKHALMMVVGGGLLMVLGAALGWVLGSFGMTPGDAIGSGTGNGAGGVQLLDDFRKHIGAFWTPFFLLVRVLGLGLLVYGIFIAISAAAPGSHANIKQAIAAMLIGGVLFNAESFVNVMNRTFFGEDAAMIDKRNFDYAEESVGGGQAEAKSALLFAYTVIGVVGFIGFVSGVNGLRKVASAHSNEGMGMSITKIIGGSLAMNLPTFISALGQSTSVKDFGSVIKFVTGG